MCLYFLDLLQYEHFRREIVNSQCCKFIDDQAILQWQHYTRKRIKMFNSVNGNTQNQPIAQPNSGNMAEAQQPLIGAQQPQQQPGQTNATVGNMQNGSMPSSSNPQQTQVGGQQQSQQQQQLNGNSSVTINQSNAGPPLMQKM